MEGTQLISKDSAQLIGIILNIPKIREVVYADVPKNETFKVLDINHETGEITLGKTSCRWWNRLLGDYRILPFDHFVFKVFNVLVGLADNMNKNAIFNGLSMDIIQKAVVNREYDYVVNRLFDVCRYGLKMVGAPTVDVNRRRSEGTDVGAHVRVEIDENEEFVPIRANGDNKIVLNLVKGFKGWTVRKG